MRRPPAHLLLPLLALLAVAPRPAAADVPTWQLGDKWRVRRVTAVNISTDTVTGALTVTETYDLTANAEVEFEGQRAYRLVRSNATVTGTGSATIPGTGTVPLSLGSGSSTTGSEIVRQGDLAMLEDSFALVLVIRATVLVPVTIANASFNSTTDSSPAVDNLDFPLNGGDVWSYHGTQHVVGHVTVDYVGLLSSLTDIDQPIDQLVPTDAEWTAAAPSGVTTAITETFTAAEATYNATFERLATRTLPPLPDSPLDSFSETVLSTTLQADPTFDFTLSPDPANSGATVQLTGTGAAAGGMMGIYLPWTGSAPLATVAADGSGAFSLAIDVPATDDGSPSNDDVGSFAVLVRNEAGKLRAHTFRRQVPGPTTGGVIVR